MSSSFRIIDYPAHISALRRKVEMCDNVIDFEKDPALASLCASIGIAREMGDPKRDRLSHYLGISLNSLSDNPYDVQVVRSDVSGFGVTIRKRDRTPFLLKHESVKMIHQLSTKEREFSDTIDTFVIYPNELCTWYHASKVKPVIVRDWILKSGLAPYHEESLNYFVSNSWEKERLIALEQAHLMTHFMIPLFGTHDIADHLLGLSERGFYHSASIASRAKNVLESLAGSGMTITDLQKDICYTLAVLLDDLAQPKWYFSKTHEQHVEYCLKFLEKTSEEQNSAGFNSDDLLKFRRS